MKVRADEHVSPEIVRAVREMALTEGWNFSQVADCGDRGSTDEHWATKFAREGGDAILSGDTDFFKRHELVVAISRTGLRIIHMPHKWANARCELQAAHILLWWKRIEKKLVAMGRLDCYRPPWNITEDGELGKVQVDYQNAEKHEKRQAKRAAKTAGGGHEGHTSTHH